MKFREEILRDAIVAQFERFQATNTGIKYSGAVYKILDAVFFGLDDWTDDCVMTADDMRLVAGVSLCCLCAALCCLLCLLLSVIVHTHIADTLLQFVDVCCYSCRRSAQQSLFLYKILSAP